MLGNRPISSAALSSLYDTLRAYAVVEATLTIDDSQAQTLYAASTEFITLARISRRPARSRDSGIWRHR
jgi:hypothetical protein